MRRSDFARLGVGVSLYFKFIKYAIWIFMIMSILSIPALTFFIGSSRDTENTNVGIYTALASTTLGNLGSSRSSCTSTEGLATPGTSESTFICSYGELREIELFGVKNEESSCENYGASLEVVEKNTCYYKYDSESKTTMV